MNHGKNNNIFIETYTHTLRNEKNEHIIIVRNFDIFYYQMYYIIFYCPVSIVL